MPARAADIIRALSQFGVEVEKPKKGSHWLCKKPGCRTYPIPLHNGTRTELSDIYIRGVCRAFDIDEAELRKLL